MPLYGNELDRDTNPYEAGLGRVVKLDKPGTSSGARRSRRSRATGPRKQLVGLALAAAPSPATATRSRVDGDGAIGVVTSGDAVADPGRADRDGATSRPPTRGGYHGRGRHPRRPASRREIVPLPFYNAALPAVQPPAVATRRVRPGGDRAGTRRPSLHAGPRVAARRGRRGRHRHHRVRRRPAGRRRLRRAARGRADARARRSRSASSSRSRRLSDLYAPGGRRGGRDQRRARRQARSWSTATRMATAGWSGCASTDPRRSVDASLMDADAYRRS